MRFPGVVFFACLSTVCALMAAGGLAPAWVETLVLVGVVSFFMGLAGYLFVERLERAAQAKTAVGLLLIIFAEGYFWWLPAGFEMMRTIDFAQVFVLILVSILAVFSSPYFRHREINGFWQYQRQLTSRLFFSVISTGTLFVGIVLSLLSIQFLFGVEMPSDWPLWIWIFIVGLVSSTVFLAGIPKQFDHLEVMGEYPYVLEIFSKYVLLPLLTLYGSILFVYGGRILVRGDWPEGGVAFLVSAYALLGILTCLLLFPRREQSLWIRPMTKVFHMTLTPLAFLLLGAVLVRVSEYGLTANRAGMLLFGAWLIGVSIFHFTKKRDDFRWLFFVTIIVVFFFSFGPLSIFSVARVSQTHELDLLLTRNGVLVDGILSQERPLSLPTSEKNRIRTITYYLFEIRGLDAVSMRMGIPKGLSPEEVLILLGLQETLGEEFSMPEMHSDQSLWFQADYAEMLAITQSSRLYPFTCQPVCTLGLNHNVSTEALVLENGVLQFKENGNRVLASVDLKEKTRELAERAAPDSASIETSVESHWVSLSDMTFESKAGPLTIKFVFDKLTAHREGEEYLVEGIDGMLLLNP